MYFSFSFRSSSSSAAMSPSFFSTCLRDFSHDVRVASTWRLVVCRQCLALASFEVSPCSDAAAAYDARTADV